MNLYQEIESYIPYNEQEEHDRVVMLSFMKNNPDYLMRSNRMAHFTASSWVVNSMKTKVLMIYHNIYNSWSWTGGHADGEEDLLNVAMKELCEETGIKRARLFSNGIFSLETLTVDGHVKRNKYVPSHLHMNMTYLIEADENDLLFIKPDENSGVRWFTFEEMVKAVSEPWMLQHVYRKLNEKVNKR
jgi:ADP-ribose pyrophosphatase YjhB (NUDIX family)